MSTLQTAAHTAVDEIPLGRRIAEIMREKGMAYSQVAMSKRLGIGRETYRLMLSGEREIYTFELDKIAKDLKMPIERILQEDVKEQVRELDRLLDEMSNSPRVVELAKYLNDLAIGWTEKCLSLRRLGRALIYHRNYVEANQVLVEAHKLATTIQEKYHDSEILFRVLFNLMDTYTAMRDFTNASNILETLEVTFQPSPHRLATVYGLQAIVKEALGQLVEAKELAYRSFESAEKSGKLLLIGQTANNVAHFEYKCKNYLTAKMFQERAIKCLENDKFYQLIVCKEYAKTLLKLKDFTGSIEVIESALHQMNGIDNEVLEGKLYLLLAIAKQEPGQAESVLQLERFGTTVRMLACKYLMEHHREQGDATKFMHYYKISEDIMGTYSEILDEGDL